VPINAHLWLVSARLWLNSARLSAVVSVQSARVQKRVSEVQKRVDNASLFDSDLWIKKVQLRPQKINGSISRLFANLIRVADGLGSCWTSNTKLTIWFLPHKEHQPLFIFCHVLIKRKTWRCTRVKVYLVVHCFSGPLCCLRQCSKREALVKPVKNKYSAAFEMSFKPFTQYAYTFSLVATKSLRRLRPAEAWNRAALWVPFCTP